MATQAQLRQRVFDNLYSNNEAERPAIHYIDGAISDSVAVLSVFDNGQAPQGSILEFEDQGEQVYVVTTGGAGSPVRNIFRARNGTTAAAHGDEAVFKMNPKYTIKQVDDAIAACLKELTLYGLYIIKNGTITLVAGQDLYELADTDVLPDKGVVSVFYQDQDFGDRLVPLPFKYVDDLGEVVGPSIELYYWGNKAAGETVNYIYKAKIDAVADTDTDTDLEELVVLGATASVMAKSGGPRTHDPGRHTDRTVQPGQSFRDASFFVGQYRRAVTLKRATLDRQLRNIAQHPKYNRALRWVWG